MSGLVINVFFAQRGNCSSTINQSYERTIYLPRGKEALELFRFRISLSIQTEPDETWRQNKRYYGMIIIELDWYDPSLFPNGICVVFEKPEIYSAGVNCTFIAGGIYWNDNITLSSSGFTSNYWNIYFDTPSYYYTDTFRYACFIFYTIYNSTSWSPPYGPTVARSYFEQPAIYITISPEELLPTYQQINSLNQEIKDLKISLTSMQNLIYVLIALFAVSLVINSLLGYSIKRLKRQTIQ